MSVCGGVVDQLTCSLGRWAFGNPSSELVIKYVDCVTACKTGRSVVCHFLQVRKDVVNQCLEFGKTTEEYLRLYLWWSYVPCVGDSHH